MVPCQTPVAELVPTPSTLVLKVASGPNFISAVVVVYSFSTDAGRRGALGAAENSVWPVVVSTTRALSLPPASARSAASVLRSDCSALGIRALVRADAEAATKHDASAQLSSARTVAPLIDLVRIAHM